MFYKIPITDKMRTMNPDENPDEYREPCCIS